MLLATRRVSKPTKYRKHNRLHYKYFAHNPNIRHSRGAFSKTELTPS